MAATSSKTMSVKAEPVTVSGTSYTYTLAMGGVDNKTSGVAAHLDPLKHTLTGCIAKGNYAAGFDRNNQNGKNNIGGATLKGTCTGF